MEHIHTFIHTYIPLVCSHTLGKKLNIIFGASPYKQTSWAAKQISKLVLPNPRNWERDRVFIKTVPQFPNWALKQTSRHTHSHTHAHKKHKRDKRSFASILSLHKMGIQTLLTDSRFFLYSCVCHCSSSAHKQCPCSYAPTHKLPSSFSQLCYCCWSCSSTTHHPHPMLLSNICYQFPQPVSCIIITPLPSSFDEKQNSEGKKKFHTPLSSSKNAQNRKNPPKLFFWDSRKHTTKLQSTTAIVEAVKQEFGAAAAAAACSRQKRR